MSNIIREEVENGYVKTLEEIDGGLWEAKFINTKHDVVLFEVQKPLKSTVQSMVGTFIKNFDYVKDKDRGVPKPKDKTGSKMFKCSSVNSGKQNPLGTVQRLENALGRGISIEEIDGVLVHFLDTSWASKYRFNHKDISYPLDFDFNNQNQIEIYTSNKDAIVNGNSLGVNYTKDHIPKLIKWLKSGIYDMIKQGLYIENDSVIHPETQSKYKNRMYIWEFHNYDVICSKSVQ